MEESVEPDTRLDLGATLMPNTKRFRRKLNSVTLVLATVITFFPATRADSAESITLDDYIALLESSSADAPQSARAVAELKSVETVRLPDGTYYQLSPNWLDTGDHLLSSRINTALTEARLLKMATESPQQNPRQVAAEIVNQSEFKQGKSLAGRIRDAVDQFLRKLTPNWKIERPDWNTSSNPGNELVEILSFLILFFVVLVIGLLIWRRIRILGSAEHDFDEEEVLWNIGPADPKFLKEVALAAVREGRYSDAIRAGYLVNLLELDRKNVISFMASATNGEFRESLQSSFGEVVDEFDRATQIFEEVHYGNHIAYARDWNRFELAWERIWSAVSS